MIKVIENALPNNIYYQLVDDILSKEPWSLVPHITVGTGNAGSYFNSLDKENYGFNANLYQSYSDYFDNYRIVANNNLFSYLNILYYICNKENILVRDIKRARLFMHTPSLKPLERNKIHVDLEERHLVLLYYFNDADGDTIFFDNEDNEIFRSTPESNKAVIFDGSIRHCSSNSSGFRCIINVDFFADILND